MQTGNTVCGRSEVATALHCGRVKKGTNMKQKMKSLIAIAMAVSTVTTSMPYGVTAADLTTELVTESSTEELFTEVTSEVETEISTEKQTEVSTEAPTDLVTEAPETELPTEKVTETTTEPPVTEATTEVLTEKVTEKQTELATEASTELQTETPTEAHKGQLAFKAHTPGGKITVTSGSGQHVIGYAEGVAPLRLEETAGTVVHVTVQADPESYEIGTYKVTLDSGAVREESVYGNGLAILDKDLVIEADATLNVGFWFNEIEKETESEEVTEVESEEITEAGSEIATEVESEDVLETETESDSETEISTEVESEVESEEGYLKIPVRFTATAGGHVELVNADGETISTVSADAPMDYLSDGVETLTAYCVPDDGYLAFAVNRTVGKSLTNFGTFENSSRVPVELSITDEESIEFVFFIEEEFADWIAKNATPRFVKAEDSTAMDISNPKVGDTFTGTAQVTGATAGYSIRDYYGDNNNPVTNYVQVTCADGELAGYKFWPTHCESGHNFYGPAIGLSGIYYVQITKVDPKQGVVGVYFTFQPYASATYQRVSGYANIPGPKFGKIRLVKRLAFADAMEGGDYDDLSAAFKVFDDSDCTNWVDTIRTDETGYGETGEDLIAGKTYYIKESTPPKNCMRSDVIKTVTIPKDTSVAAPTVKFVDQPYHLMLRILKVDGDTKKWNDDLKGTKFGLFSSKTCNSASMLDEITINSAAGARFSTRLAVGKTYYIQETSAATSGKYEISSIPRKFTVTKNMIADKSSASSSGMIEYSTTIENTQDHPIRIRLYKSISGVSKEIKDLDNYTVEDCLYGLYYDSNCTELISEMAIRASGFTDAVEIPFKYKELYKPGEHTLYVKELDTNTGLALDGEKQAVVFNYVEGETARVVKNVYNEGIVGFGAMVYKYEEISGNKTPLKGVQFTISHYTAQNGPQSATPTATWVLETDENGEISTYTADKHLISGDPLYRNAANAVVWPRGYYKIVETEALDGYEIDPTEYWVTVHYNTSDKTDPKAVFRQIKVKNTGTSKVSVKKTSENTAITDGNSMYSFEGATFGVYTGPNKTGEKKGTLTAKADGTTNKLELDVGTYYVHEESAPKGYKLNDTDFKVTLAAGENKEVTIADEPKSAGINIAIKKSGPKGTDKLLVDAHFIFKYYSADSATGTPTRTWVLKTDAAGNVIFDAEHFVSGDAFYIVGDEIKLPIGTITVQETKAPDGYAIKQGTWTYNIIDEGTTGGPNGSIPHDGILVEETPVYGGVSIPKLDRETNGAAQGDATLAGAVFQIINADTVRLTRKDIEGSSYDPGAEVARITTNANGVAQIGAVLQAGKYTIKEVTPPTGYKNSAQSINFEITTDGQIVDLSATPITDLVQKGGFHFRKSDHDTGDTTPQGDASFAGAKFNVINRSAKDVLVNGTLYKPGQVVLSLITDANGAVSTGLILPFGTYGVVETQAPKGYTINPQELKVEIHAEKDYQITDTNGLHTWDETAAKGGFTIQKDDADTGEYVSQGDASLAGAEFTIKNVSAKPVVVNGKKYAKGQTIMILTTDENGFAETGRKVLPVGVYTVEETKAPEGYFVDKAVKTVEIRTDDQYDKIGYTAESDFLEQVYRGGFTVQKLDSETKQNSPQGDASLAGAEFTVTNVSKHPVMVGGKEYEPGQAVMTLTTDAKGFAETGRKALPYGTYEVRETKAPEGYFADKAVKTVEIRTEDQYGTVGYTAESDFFEQIFRGGFQISKWDMELNKSVEIQGDATLEGAEFTLTNLSKHSVIVDGKEYAANSVIKVFSTDKNGNISVPENYLPYGTYKIEETKPPVGYTPEGENLSRIFTIRKDKEIHDFTTEETATKNRVIRFDISIIKFKDTSSSEEPGDRVEPLEGIEFEIRLKSTDELITTLVTDKDGYATTIDKENYPDGRLPYGTYTVTETKHPDGVMPIKPFDIFGDTDHKEYKGIYLNNRPIEMPITLYKKSADNQLIIPVAGTEFQILDADKNVITFHAYYPHPIEITNFVTDESGTITLPEKLEYGTYYLREVHAPNGYLKGEDLKFVVDEWGSWTDPLPVDYYDAPAKGVLRIAKTDASTQEALAGAVFSVFANEDIVTPDGFKHYAKGQFVEAVTIGKDGKGQSNELTLGKYYVQETKAPEGFCLDTKQYPFELVYADENTPIVYVDMERENLPTTLKLLKSDIDGLVLDGITFEMTRIGNIESSGIPFDGAITGGTFVTENGGVITAKYLVSGIYSVKETATLPGYVLDDTVRFVTVDENGYIFESDENGTPVDEDASKSDTETLHWINDYTKWDFSKVDVTGDVEIAGAEMEIYNEAGELVYSWISDGSIHRINKIPLGSYTLVEKTAPEGYVKASSIDFEVTNTGVVQKLTMLDKQVDVIKVDQDGERVIGAKMEVREIKAPDELEDSDPAVVDSWVTDGSVHHISNLEVGKAYEISEVEAPEGWVQALPIAFEVPDDGQNQEITVTDKRVKAHKYDETLETYVEGAELEVRDLNGKTIDRWVTGSEYHYISGLVAGHSYILFEMKAPDGYALANPVAFTVDNNGLDQEIRMVNKKVLVSKVDTEVEQLKGAELEVRDRRGNLIDSWVSDGSPHAIKNLLVGETYILIETKAPEGYALAVPITFTVADDAKNDQISLVNKQIFVSKQSITGSEELPGAKLTVTHKETGETMDSWVSGKEQHAVKNLIVGGTYVLHEETAPDGYVVASSIEFTVMDDGLNQTVFMKDKQVTVKKLDSEGNGVVGAKMQVITAEMPLSADGEPTVVDSWVTDGKGHHVSGLEVGRNYILVEEEAPESWVKANPVAFSVPDDGKDQEISMTDTRMKANKVDADGKPVEGAELEVRDRRGNLIDKWTSDGTTHDISNLLVGEVYTLIEVKAPEGWVLANPVEFIVLDDEKNQEISMTDIRVKANKVDTEGNPVEGAELEVRDFDGEVLDSWVTGKEAHFISGLTAGHSYKLVETKAPDGYAVALPVNFTVEDSGSDQEVTMINKQVLMSKVDTKVVELPGAELEVRDEEGNVVDSWTSDGKPHAIKGLEVGKNYTLVETKAPDGYAIAKPITFTVADDAKNDQISLVNKQIFVSKQSITGSEELPGAKLTVTHKETGETMDSWVSGKEQHAVKNLIVGETYILHEETAPDGYVVASSIEFTVTDDGADQTVEMKDKQLYVSKKDVTGEKELQGAQLTVIDKESGKAVDSWTSTEEQHAVSGLTVNKTYILREETAPEGYVIASEIEFTVADDFIVQHVEMKDKQLYVYKKDVTGERELQGAQLTVIDKENGKAVDSWTSTEEQYAVSGLTVNKTYILREETAPEGYVVASEIEFTVADDFTVQTVIMEDKQVFVSKKDVTGDEELPGAELTVTDKETGKVVDSWTSGEKEHPVTGLEVGKTYVLKEETAPDGYTVAEEIEFTVEDNFTVQHVEMKDKQVFVSKIDITTEEEIEGAELKVIDSDGKTVDSWTSGKKPHAVSGLTVGETYVLKEELAPDGYVTAEEIEFTAKDNFKIQTVIMKDDYTKVEISKQDATTGKELPGAKLSLKDAKGNVIDTWTSTEKPHYIEYLAVGDYILHEDMTPLGYEIANDVKFTVEETGEVQKVVMKDEVTPTKTDSPKTGDTTNVTMEIILTLLSGSVIFGYLRKRRKIR